MAPFRELSILNLLCGQLSTLFDLFGLNYKKAWSVSITDQNRAQNADSEEDEDYLDSNSASDIQKTLP